MADNEEKKSEVSEPTEEKNESEVLEFEFNEDGEEDLKKTLKKLRSSLKVCQKEKEEYLTGWQKERAEFTNYKKQEEDRKINFSEAVRERILSRFLSVLDSFNMAFSNKEAWEKVDEGWRKGVEHIYAQINEIFEEYGIKPIGEAGESFDPNIHHSIEMVSTNKKEEDHKVCKVVQKGYKLGDRMIRVAQVNVFEYNEPTTEK
jgi:molecular chaperone GrpE